MVSSVFKKIKKSMDLSFFKLILLALASWSTSGLDFSMLLKGLIIFRLLKLRQCEKKIGPKMSENRASVMGYIIPMRYEDTSGLLTF